MDIMNDWNKLDEFLFYMNSGGCIIHVDANKDVKLPMHLMFEDNIVLQIDQSVERSETNDKELVCDLVFDGLLTTCVIPWEAIYYMRSPSYKKLRTWFKTDTPSSILKRIQKRIEINKMGGFRLIHGDGNQSSTEKRRANLRVVK